MLTLLLLGQSPSAEAVINRYDQFLKKTNTVSVTVKGRVNGRSFGTGALKVARPDRCSLVVKLQGGDATFVLNGERGLEIDHPNLTYEEWDAYGKNYVPQFQLGTVLNFASPASLIQGSSRGMLPQGVPWQVKPKVTVNGVVTDMVSGKAKTEDGTIEVKAWIDASGKLIKFSSNSQSGRGILLVEQELSNYVINQKIPDTVFSTKWPVGYTPHRLHRGDFGLHQAEPVPNVELRKASNNEKVTLSSLISGANTMVVLTDPEFPSNAAMLKSVRELSSKIPDFRMVVVSVKRDVASAQKIGVSDIYFDPTGASIKKLGVPGSPTMLLIDKKGKLAQMFMGFDGSWEELDQVIEALKKGK